MVNQSIRSWSTFSSVWNSTYDEKSPPDYSDFLHLFDWRIQMKLNGTKPLFFITETECPSYLHSIVTTPGIGLSSIYEADGLQFVANSQWCDSENFNETTSTCSQESAWGHIPNGNLEIEIKFKNLLLLLFFNSYFHFLFLFYLFYFFTFNYLF